MRVFVSWSGPRSRRLANALRTLLPDVIQNLEVWMSEHDIQAGVRWSLELSTRLAQCQLGIACVTADNQTAPWLMFEAGAISKSLEQGRLVPLLLDLEPAQVTHPLAQFQLVTVERSGINKLFETLNSLSDSPLSAERLWKQLDRIWPELHAAIQEAKDVGVVGPIPEQRGDREVLYEILERVRAISTSVPTPSPPESTPLTIDTRPFVGKNGEVLRIGNVDDLSASDLLDEVWRVISKSEDVPPFSYNDVWVLHSERLQGPLVDVARDYIRSRGQRRDDRTVDKFGIWPGDKLEVRQPKGGEI